MSSAHFSQFLAPICRMASNVPIIRQINWFSVIPQILLIGIFIYIYYLLDVENPFILGALTYLILSLGVRFIFTVNHRKGMNFVKQERFADAIPYFEKSINYFAKNSWLDRYRFLTLLSSSKMSYREMGLCNIAFCYTQIGNKSKAIEFYQQAIEDYPNNGLAKAALNIIHLSDEKTLENKTN